MNARLQALVIKDIKNNVIEYSNNGFNTDKYVIEGGNGARRTIVTIGRANGGMYASIVVNGVLEGFFECQEKAGLLTQNQTQLARIVSECVSKHVASIFSSSKFGLRMAHTFAQIQYGKNR